VSELDGLLQFALQLADVADSITLSHFRRGLQTAVKADRTFVTQADTEVERTVRQRIKERFPNHGFLGEELGHDIGDGESRWILDPIDSTHNYMRGIPVFATLLAFEREGSVELGVISAPAMGERWQAIRGQGAFNGNRRLHVSGIDRLKDAVIFYASRGAFEAVGMEAGFDAVVAASWRDRGFGDFWGYALVAEGTGEAMIEPELYPWDLAAPLVIIEEAGGRLTDFQGNRTYQGGNAVASNGLLHQEVLERLQHPSDYPARNVRDP
jgi:histidinol-phosphatase